VIQLVPFDRVAWHAGRSRWRGLEGLNRHSIGIELDNAGLLERAGNGWQTWFKKAVPGDEIVEAAHRNDGVMRGWHAYTEAQVEAAIACAQAIVGHYGLIDVIGHDDIAPGRKTDPGLAFPMTSFRSAVIGRSDDDLETFETTARLNIREGAGVGHARLEASPLARGTRLRMIEEAGRWCLVEVLDGNSEPDLTGWVHGDYIRRV